MSYLQFLFLRIDDNHHTLAFQFGQLLWFAVFFHGLGKFQQNQLSLVFIDNGTTLEKYVHLYLASFLQKFNGMIALELKVVVIGLGSQADFLDDNLRGFLLDFLLLFLLLIKEFLIIHHLAYRWIGLRRNLHQIQFKLVG